MTFQISVTSHSILEHSCDTHIYVNITSILCNWLHISVQLKCPQTLHQMKKEVCLVYNALQW